MSEEITPIKVTGIGSWPGEDFADAVKITLAECPDFPYFPELPARGAAAGMIGRATAVLPGLAFDLQPAGWRMNDGSSHDHRRASALLRNDLDQLEEQAQGYQGLMKFAFTGPWTLAASIERVRGDRVLADHGARRDLAQSLAEGLLQLVTELARRLPEIKPVIQLDEPLLPAVLAGRISTASGFSKHRTVPDGEAGQALANVIGALPEGVPNVLHSCAPQVPIKLLREAGFVGIAVDLDQPDHGGWDQLAEAMEQGVWLGAGVLPSDATLTPDQLAARVLAPLRRLELDPAIASRLVLTPACGLANRTVANAVHSLRTLRSAADIVTDQLAA